jgi:hypothetical protein
MCSSCARRYAMHVSSSSVIVSFSIIGRCPDILHPSSVSIMSVGNASSGSDFTFPVVVGFLLVLCTFKLLCYETDGRARLDPSLQHAVCSEIPFFCSNFNSKRSSNSTNLPVHMANLLYIAAMCSLV